VLWEQIEAGLDEEEVARTFDLDVDDVIYARVFERSLRAA
jgi:hypothetical protein